MLRHSLDRFRIPSSLVAMLLALFAAASAQTPFAAIDAKGEISVDDAGNPTRLSSDLKSTFALGANSTGINPLAEDLKLVLQYGSAVGPMYIVFVPAGCFTQSGHGYRVQMNDISFNCALSIRLENVSQGQGEILPFVDLLPAVDKFDLRLTPGLNGTWDLKLSTDFLGSNANVPIAVLIGALRSPNKVKLAIGDDAGEVPIGKIEFKGDN